MTASNSIGNGIAAARDVVARVLIALGATPNRLTVLGFLLTVAAAVVIAIGAHDRSWLLAAGGLMFLSGALDMLDGAVARVGKMSSRFGGFLDSTLDRWSDVALYVGFAVHYAGRGNVTYNLLAVWGLAAALLISHARARAEAQGIPCKVGYWERGERFVAMLIACFGAGVPAMLWQLAAFPTLTAVHRLMHTWNELAGRPDEGGPAVSDATSAPTVGAPKPEPGEGYTHTARSESRPLPWWGRLVFTDYRRGGFAYDVVTASHILFILLAPITDEWDGLGNLIRSSVRPAG